MFDNLTERLARTVKNLRGQGRLTEDNIRDTLREVRMALLEADVALPVVREFVERVRQRAIGTEVMRSLTPGQAFVKIVRDELIAVMGGESAELSLNGRPPSVILMVGLQGSGKTLTAAKLAYWLKEKKKSVTVVSTDIYRPAAIEQLRVLASEIGVDFFPVDDTGKKPIAIAQEALEHTRRRLTDILIVDTAGRLHVDDAMIEESKALHQALTPTETLFVVDSMTGQVAAEVAASFNAALPLTGVVLTKADGDARGGAALSVRHVTGCPVKFLGVGEKPPALERFQPESLASRILGMGDVLGLVEEAERNLDRHQAAELASKLKKHKGFDLEDFRHQLRQIRNMGGITKLADKLPGLEQTPQSVQGQVNDNETRRLEAIINSMTPQERKSPGILKGSRKRRIAAGSGTRVQDVNRLLKQFEQTQRLMKQVSKGGLNKLMRDLKNRIPS